MDPRELDQDVRRDLRSLSKETADLTAAHLVMTGRLLDEDPERALAHARAAGALAGRVGAVREAGGLAAYAAEQWAEALSELRAARRLTGRADHLAVLADCERALGRPERALAVLDDPDVPRLEQATRVELVIVVAGARRDLGQPDAAVLLLQGPARATTARRPWAARLWYAYADALLAAGRDDEAREWFARAAETDGQGETDALDRLLELDGVVLEDLQDGDDSDDAEPEQVDLQALLTGPVPARPGASAAGPIEVADLGVGQEDLPEAAVGSAQDDAPASSSGEVRGQEQQTAAAPADEAGAGHGSTEEAPPASERTAAPLFSNEEAPAPSRPASAVVPGVTFAAPPPEDPPGTS